MTWPGSWPGGESLETSWKVKQSPGTQENHYRSLGHNANKMHQDSQAKHMIFTTQPYNSDPRHLLQRNESLYLCKIVYRISHRDVVWEICKQKITKSLKGSLLSGTMPILQMPHTVWSHSHDTN